MGVIKGAVRVGIGALLFLCGYMFHGYVHDDRRYRLERIDDAPYLVDKRSGQELRIYEHSMQVGSLEHRLQGVLEDPRMMTALQELERGYGRN